MRSLLPFRRENDACLVVLASSDANLCARLMNKTREEIIAERQRLKAEYRGLFDEVAALILRHDPVGINFKDNADEYEAEVGSILPRLRSCQSADDVRRVVHQEFVRWFDAGIEIAVELLVGTGMPA